MRTFSKQKKHFQQISLQSKLPKHISCSKFDNLQFFQETDRQFRIGKYKIFLDSLLGKGFSSSVYKCVEVGKQLKRYAAKVIQLKGFNSSCLKLFEGEIEIHRKLNHEHIVRCYDVYKTKTHIYMIMEYCPHGDLDSYIKQRKKIAEHSIIDIMTQIVSGYKYLAKQKILHRDLKPANILRSGKIWKISDFGFSVRSDRGFVDNLNVGTPTYMPIEALSRSYYSTKTDIFALGIILYELFHGKTPWSSKSEKELMKKICKQKIIIEKEIKNTKVKQFIMKCCEIKEENRLNENELFDYDFNSDSKANSQIKKCEELFNHSSNYSTGQSFNTFVESNTDVLMSELNLCKFLYSMIQHIESFLLQPDKKSTFLMVLLKYMLKTIKTLQDGKFTTKRLIKFDEYKTNDEYGIISAEISEYSAKYEKTYLDYIKAAKIDILRNVNNKFPEFTKSFQLFDSQFYIKMRIYLQDILKENNKLLNEIINDPEQEQYLSEKLEAFQNLIILYKMIDIRSKGQSISFKANSLSNYSSTSIKKTDYLNMRKQIMHI